LDAEHEETMPDPSARPARVLIADDHDVVRRGLRALVEAAGHQVCGEAATGREAVEIVARTSPHVAVLDVSMPDLNGLEAARRIAQEHPATEVLVLTAHDSEETVREALAAGARGYMLKSDAAGDLVAAIEDLLRHRPHFTSRVAEMVLEGYLGRSEGPAPAAAASPTARLTAREREVLQLLAEGGSTKEIAAALRISVKTVETHRTNIMRTLDLATISELVRWAVRNRIIEA
jgi:DNA-binding NarL/FixJ family response regulator